MSGVGFMYESNTPKTCRVCLHYYTGNCRNCSSMDRRGRERKADRETPEEERHQVLEQNPDWRNEALDKFVEQEHDPNRSTLIDVGWAEEKPE